MGWFRHSLLAAGTVIALTGPATAIPVTWQLENAVFASGRTATGSFVFDADTGVYSSIAPFGQWRQVLYRSRSRLRSSRSRSKSVRPDIRAQQLRIEAG